MKSKSLTDTNIFRISKTLLYLLLILPFNKVIAQSYQFSDVKEAYYLFAERKEFYPDFNFAVNSSVGLESVVNGNGECDFRIIIDDKVAPIYAVRTKVDGDIIDIWFEDRNGFRALMRVTLLSNGRLQMYFPPERTETEDFFVYGFNIPKTYGFNWYEPTMNGLIFHPDAKTGQEAIKKYYSKYFDRSFDDIIREGKYKISRKMQGTDDVKIFDGDFEEEKSTIECIRINSVDRVFSFSEGLAVIKKGDKYGYKYGYIDKNGDVVIPVQFDQALGFSEGLAAVEKDGKWGFIDKNEDVVIPMQDELYFARSFSEGLVVAEKDGKYGYIDKSGDMVIPIQYTHFNGLDCVFDAIDLSFTEGLATFATFDSGIGFIDRKGNVIIPSDLYDYADPFSEGLAVVCKDGKSGYIDKTTSVVIPIQYASAYPFSEGLAAVKKDDKWGYIDKNGEIVIPIKYGSAKPFSEGLAVVSENYKCGYIDKNGEIVIPIQYGYAEDFSEGLAAVKKDGKWGYIDKNGEIVIPMQYDEGYSFSDGVAVVRNDGEWFLLIGGTTETNDIVVDNNPVAENIHQLIVSLYNDTLQQAINDYNTLLGYYPYDYEENSIAYSLSFDLPDNTNFLHDTLHSLLETINKKKTQIMERYPKDILLFRQLNDSLQERINEANARLLEYPYNLQKRIIEDRLPVSLFGNTEGLTIELNSKIATLSKRMVQVEQEIYADAKNNNPQRFCEIYFAQNPIQKQFADSIYVECRCKYPNRNSFYIAVIDNTLSDCDCRDKQYQDVSYLYHSREEFDQAYNKEENAFFQELDERKKSKRELSQLEKTLVTQQQIKMKNALSSSKPEIMSVVNQVSWHRNGYYYEDAVELLLKYDDKMLKEWEKNGAYFKSKAEMYEYYIGEDYEKALRAKRRE